MKNVNKVYTSSIDAFTVAVGLRGFLQFVSNSVRMICDGGREGFWRTMSEGMCSSLEIPGIVELPTWQVLVCAEPT